MPAYSFAKVLSGNLWALGEGWMEVDELCCREYTTSFHPFSMGYPSHPAFSTHHIQIGSVITVEHSIDALDMFYLLLLLPLAPKWHYYLLTVYGERQGMVEMKRECQDFELYSPGSLSSFSAFHNLPKL